MQQIETEALDSGPSPAQCFREKHFTSLSLSFSTYKTELDNKNIYLKAVVMHWVRTCL